jgi:penicillin-binding protein 1A
MQRYAEEAVYGHVAKFLQPAFNKENKTKRNAPFTEDLTFDQLRSILTRNVRQSERYRSMRANGMSDSEIRKVFNRPVDMTIFWWTRL